MPTEDKAVQLLKELGLTEYESQCFVALSRVPKATARDVSDMSDVPRSRVYDAVDRLHKRGLVDVQQSEPREYRAVSKESALDLLRENYGSTLEATDEALGQLHTSDELEESGAWAITDQDHVTDRITMLVEDGGNEIYALIADERMLDRQFRDLFSVASERDISVFVEVPSKEVKEKLLAEAPAATVVETELAQTPAKTGKKWLGRMVMVDRESVLLSAVTESSLPGQLEETAIWASGTNHGLVVGLHHLLGARVDNPNIFQQEP